MQSRNPRLDWIAKVLAEPGAPGGRGDRAVLRLVSNTEPVPGAGDAAPVIPMLRRRTSSLKLERPKKGR
jgi:hypothetical protein